MATVKSKVPYKELEGVDEKPVATDSRSPRELLLDEAKTIVMKDRNANYGNPEDNFRQIANLWTAYWNNVVSGVEVTFNAHDVAIMCMLIKIARLAVTPNHHDSAVDVAGYAACLAEIQAISRRNSRIE